MVHEVQRCANELVTGVVFDLVEVRAFREMHAEKVGSRCAARAVWGYSMELSVKVD